MGLLRMKWLLFCTAVNLKACRHRSHQQETTVIFRDMGINLVGKNQKGHFLDHVRDHQSDLHLHPNLPHRLIVPAILLIEVMVIMTRN